MCLWYASIFHPVARQCHLAYIITLKTLLKWSRALSQVGGECVSQPVALRPLSDHGAGSRPSGRRREHDDPGNYKGDITDVNLILQTAGMLSAGGAVVWVTDDNV